MDVRIFLEAERRRIIKMFMLGLMIILVCFEIGIGLLFFLTSSSALLFLFVCAVFAIIGDIATWALIRHTPIWLAVLPITIGLLLATIGVGLWLPEIGFLAVAMFLTLLWICNLSNNRSLMLSVAGVGIVLVILIFGVTLPVGPTFTLGAAQPFAAVLIALGTILASTLLADRFIGSQNAALALAEQRSADAESARAEAVAAHAEVERLQAAEQLRLIALVETLELPIISVGEQTLVVPLVGEIDRRRIVSIQQRLLGEVSRQHVRTVVLDLTGVSLLDTHVAQQIVLMAQAVQLLGAHMLLSGIRPEVAQTLTTLQIDLAGMRPVANLGAALRLNYTAA